MTNAGSVTQTDRAKLHKGMTSREIKAELILRGISIKQIAEVAGVTSGAVTQTIYQYHQNNFKGYRIRKYIAQALDRKVEDIWYPGENSD